MVAFLHNIVDTDEVDQTSTDPLMILNDGQVFSSPWPPEKTIFP